MSAGDSRYFNQTKKLMAKMSFPDHFQTKVDMKKVNKAVIEAWMTESITKCLGFEDEIVVSTAINLLDTHENNTLSPDPKELQMSLTGFLGKASAAKFMNELWSLLLSAQENSTGIPTQILEKKKAELKQLRFEQEEKEKKVKDRLDQMMQVEKESSVVKSKSASTEAAVKDKSNSDYRSKPSDSDKHAAADDDDFYRQRRRLDDSRDHRRRRSRSPFNDGYQRRSSEQRNYPRHRRSRSRSRTEIYNERRRRRRSRSRTRTPPRRSSRKNTASRSRSSSDRSRRSRSDESSSDEDDASSSSEVSKQHFSRRRTGTTRRRKSRSRSYSDEKKKTRYSNKSDERPHGESSSSSRLTRTTTEKKKSRWL